MECKKFESTASAYLDRQLTDAETAAYRAHLASCGDCRLLHFLLSDFLFFSKILNQFQQLGPMTHPLPWISSQPTQDTCLHQDILFLLNIVSFRLRAFFNSDIVRSQMSSLFIFVPASKRTLTAARFSWISQISEGFSTCTPRQAKDFRQKVPTE